MSDTRPVTLEEPPLTPSEQRIMDKLLRHLEEEAEAKVSLLDAIKREATLLRGICEEKEVKERLAGSEYAALRMICWSLERIYSGWSKGTKHRFQIDGLRFEKIEEEEQGA